MVDFAALRVEGAGLSSRITTEQADAQDLGAWQVRSAFICLKLPACAAKLECN